MALETFMLKTSSFFELLNLKCNTYVKANLFCIQSIFSYLNYRSNHHWNNKTSHHKCITVTNMLANMSSIFELQVLNEEYCASLNILDGSNNTQRILYTFCVFTNSQIQCEWKLAQFCVSTITFFNPLYSSTGLNQVLVAVPHMISK
jgi:hypothetical protein